MNNYHGIPCLARTPTIMETSAKFRFQKNDQVNQIMMYMVFLNIKFQIKKYFKTGAMGPIFNNLSIASIPLV